MKKLITIAFAALFLLSAASCAKSISFQVLEVGSFDNISGANHMSQFSYEDTESFYESAEKKREFKFSGEDYLLENNKPYSLEYHETIENGFAFDDKVHEYRVFNDSVILFIHVDAKTDEIVYFFGQDSEYLKTLGQRTKKTRDECYEQAKKILNSFTDNGEAFSLTEERVVNLSETETYDFIFNRYIDGVKSNEEIIIMISVYGDLVSYSLDNLGTVNEAPPSEKNMRKIEASVDAKMNEIYSNVLDKYSVTFEIADVMYIRLKDGHYALDYFIDAELSQRDGEDNEFSSFSERTHLIVLLE